MMSEYRTIILTQGQVARVSPHRYEELSRNKWFAAWSPLTQSFYAKRNARTPDGKRYQTSMHRQIMGLDYGDPRQVDHKNRKKTLDNTDENLRFADDIEQKCNQGPKRTNKSGYKGVCWSKKAKKWVAQIQFHGKNKWLGCYDTPELAYAAYCEAAKKYHREFACVA
jgi:hypothetical protein